MSEGKSIAKNFSDSVRNYEEPDYLQMISFQATGDIEAVGDGALFVENSSEPLADVVSEDAHPVSIEVLRGGSRSLASVAHSSGVQDADLLALCSRIQELRGKNEDLLSRRAANQNRI